MSYLVEKAIDYDGIADYYRLIHSMKCDGEPCHGYLMCSKNYDCEVKKYVEKYKR